MIRKGVLKSFDSSTYKATVQIVGSLNVWLSDVPTSHALSAEDMVAGRFVAVLTPDPGKPGDSVVTALWSASTPPTTPATCTSGVMTIYVDSAAIGAEDGTSWTNAFTTIQDAWDSLPDIIAHAVTIKVRKGTNPYREQVDVDSRYVIGSVTIEGEYHWQGDCEANVGGAGEITDTGAFADVAVGDKVFVLDLNGANGRAQNGQYGTVDSVANVPNRIGTTLTVTPSTGWIYVICRTEISGSDDGTDGGTARDACFSLTSVDNINIYGFYITFSDYYAYEVTNSNNLELKCCIFENCDLDTLITQNSACTVWYCYLSGLYGARVDFLSAGVNYWYCLVEGCDYGLVVYRLGMVLCRYSFFKSCTNAVYGRETNWVEVNRCTIDNGCTKGIWMLWAGFCRQVYVTNNATTPKTPAAASDPSWIS